MKKRLVEWIGMLVEQLRQLWKRIDRFFPERMGRTAKIAAVFILITLFTMATPVMAAWSDRHLLPTLSSMNIFALVENLSGMTDQMVTETAGLEREVEQAGKKLASLDRQEQLIASQLQTHQEIQRELERQLAGNIEAREWMNRILAREGQTHELTGNVSNLAGTISGQMSGTIRHLKSVSDSTSAIIGNSRKMNGQLDVLLAELDRSAENLRFIARIPEAVRFLEDKTGLDLPLSGDSGSSKPSSPGHGNVLPDLPVNLPGLTEPSEPKSEPGDDSSGGLLDLLLP